MQFAIHRPIASLMTFNIHYRKNQRKPCDEQKDDPSCEDSYKGTPTNIFQSDAALRGNICSNEGKRLILMWESSTPSTNNRRTI